MRRSASALVVGVVAAAVIVVVASSGVSALGANCTDGVLCFDDTLPTEPLYCYPGFYCPGNQTAQLCPAGSYCLTPTSIEKCPAGYYCPPSTVEPKECSPFAACPAGSDRYFLWGGLLLALAPLVIIICYKRFVVDRSLTGTVPTANATELTANEKGGANRKRAESIAAGLQAVDRSSSAADMLSPFSDSGATMRMLARMSVGDKPDSAAQAAAAVGGIAVPLPPSAATSMVVQNPVNLRFDKLVSAVQVDGKPKVIMQSVSGAFRAGRVAAVMGPSGAGKTTLFRILMGKLPVTGGTVYLNEKPADLRQLTGRTGFVPQADIMISTLTVRDVLVHAARTRLPATMSDHAKLERVDDLMRALSITHIQHSIIGDPEAGQRGISGGERKRVSIGIELVANPSVLLLDEPTTGLDSTTSLDVVQLLKTIAQTQRVTVVAVLHQPRNLIFDLFDDLVLLAPGGRTVFSGPSSKALNYFASTGYPCPPKGNPADHFIDVISGASGAPQPGGTAAIATTAVPGPGPASGEKKSAPAAADDEPEKVNPAEVQVRLVQAWQNEEARRAALAGAASGTPSAAQSAQTAVSPKSALKIDESLAGANWFQQVGLTFYRGLLQQVRGPAINTVLLELFFQLFCGVVIGIAFVHENWFLPPMPPQYSDFCPKAMRDFCKGEPLRDLLLLEATFICMALGLIAAVTGVRTFGAEVLNMSREVASGASASAYFVGKCLSDLPAIIIYSLVFTSTFYVMAAPNAHFTQFFAIILYFEWTMYGLGYVCSVMFKAQENALIMAVVASLLAGLATDNMDPQKSAAWSRWTSESIFLAEVRADSLTGATRELFQQYLDVSSKFNLDNWSQTIVASIVYGVVLRILSLILLRRRQQTIEANT